MILEKLFVVLEQKRGLSLLVPPQTEDNCGHLGEMGQLSEERGLVFQLIFTNKVRGSTHQLSCSIGVGRVGVEEVTHSEGIGNSRY